MKYLVSLFLALPLLTSCNMVQDEYYERGYYNPPPPPRVEIIPNNNYPQYHEHNRYRPMSRGRVYHGHQGAGSNAVVVNPRVPQVHVQPNVHGHNGTVSGRPQPVGPKVVIQPNVHGHVKDQIKNVHGHEDTNTVRHGDRSGTQVEVQQTQHGHN